MAKGEERKAFFESSSSSESSSSWMDLSLSLSASGGSARVRVKCDDNVFKNLTKKKRERTLLILDGAKIRNKTLSLCGISFQITFY